MLSAGTVKSRMRRRLGNRRERRRADARGLTIGFAATRIAYAAAVVIAPEKAAGPWLGEAVESGGGRAAVRALVARDALLSAGFGIAAACGEPVRPWLAAVVASDVADIASTLADRDHLPEHSAPGTVVLAGAAAVIGIALYCAADA
jgi:hypothetical protein